MRGKHILLFNVDIFTHVRNPEVANIFSQYGVPLHCNNSVSQIPIYNCCIRIPMSKFRTPWSLQQSHALVNYMLNGKILSVPGAFVQFNTHVQIAKIMGPTWGPPGSYRPQVGPMQVPWIFLSGCLTDIQPRISDHPRCDYASKIHYYRCMITSDPFSIYVYQNVTTHVTWDNILKICFVGSGNHSPISVNR